MSRSAVELGRSIALLEDDVWGQHRVGHDVGRQRRLGHVRERDLLMEKVPSRPGRDTDAVVTTVPVAAAARSDWRTGLPTLSGSMITLRELRLNDASALFESLTTDEVVRFISPPPSSVEGFERFIAWTLRQRAAGQYVCFAVVPRGSDVAIGLFQIRSLEPEFGNAEWGFAIDSKFWGTGCFRTVRSWQSTLPFTYSARIASRRARRRKTDAATAHCRRSARSRKRYCDVRSSATASITIRRCGRFSVKTGRMRRSSPGPRSCISSLRSRADGCPPVRFSTSS